MSASLLYTHICTVDALDQGTHPYLPPPLLSEFKGTHRLGQRVHFLRFGSLFGPYFIKVGITVSQGSNPLNKTEIPRKNLPLKMGEKNLNKDFSNTRRGGGGHHFEKVFLKNLDFFK